MTSLYRDSVVARHYAVRSLARLGRPRVAWEVAVARLAINRIRTCAADQDKRANDGEAELVEIAVERAGAIPKFAAQTEFVTSQAERLDAADELRDLPGSDHRALTVTSAATAPASQHCAPGERARPREARLDTHCQLANSGLSDRCAWRSGASSTVCRQ
jgi:hypothetical protein